MNLRPIDIAGQSPVAPESQPAPMLQWVKIADLVIDDRYQRPLQANNWTAIRRIAEAFRWSRFTPVLCAPIEGGRFAVIDGQHRTHAAAICGFEAVPAMVVPVPAEEQARAFADVNSRSIRVSSYHILKAALAAREPWAIRAQDAVEAAGCQLMTYHASAAAKKSGQVFCPTLVQRFVASGMAEALTVTLTALRLYDERSDRPALYTDYILAPVVPVVAGLMPLSADDLADFMRAVDPFRLMDRAEATGTALRPSVTDRARAFRTVFQRWQQTRAAA